MAHRILVSKIQHSLQSNWLILQSHRRWQLRKSEKQPCKCYWNLRCKHWRCAKGRNDVNCKSKVIVSHAKSLHNTVLCVRTKAVIRDLRACPIFDDITKLNMCAKPSTIADGLVVQGRRKGFGGRIRGTSMRRMFTMRFLIPEIRHVFGNDDWD